MNILPSSFLLARSNASAGEIVNEILAVFGAQTSSFFEDANSELTNNLLRDPFNFELGGSVMRDPCSLYGGEFTGDDSLLDNLYGNVNNTIGSNLVADGPKTYAPQLYINAMCDLFEYNWYCRYLCLEVRDRTYVLLERMPLLHASQKC